MDLDNLIPEEQTTENLIPLKGNQFKICELSPAHFDQFAKITSLLDSNDIIVIENSRITQEINKRTAVLSTDISSLIGPGINLHILNPALYLKVFRAMKSNANIQIIDDPDEARYLVANGESDCLMAKKLDNLETLEPFDFTDCTYIGEVLTFTKDERRHLRNFMVTGEEIEIIVKDNQPKALHIPGVVTVKFPKYVKDHDISEVSADFIIKSFNFLSIDGETYEMILTKKNEKYYLVTKINNGYLNVQVSEEVQLSNDDNLLV